MKTTDVTVSVGVTKNIGNYESVRLDYSYRVMVDDDESPRQIRKDLFAYLKESVLRDVNKVMEK